LFVLFITPPAAAQVLYGSLTGNVTDASGAGVPKAQVAALNVGTGATREVTTDPSGVYLINELQPGTYTVTISASGFAKLLTENVRVSANTVRRVDVRLEVAKVAQQVTVEASPAVLQTDRADVHTQLDASQIASLPMTSSVGRNVQALYRLVPGFTQVYEGVSSEGGAPMRSMTGNVNGSSFQENLTKIDGTLNTYIWLPMNTAYVPPSEGVAEVNVVTNSYDAEQGNSNGATVNVITKSGTNQFHGSAFEYHDDNALRALNRFQAAGTHKPKYILNEFGGSIGGPIKKNKLFFFADEESIRRVMLAQATKTVINPAGIFDSSGNANLSAAIPAGTNCNTSNVAGCIYDPNTGNANGTGRTAFANNTIPASRIDPAAKTILSRINTSGFINTTGPLATNNFIAEGSALFNRDTLDTKINYAPSHKSTIYGRYSIFRALLFDPPALGQAMGGSTGGGQVGTAPSRVQDLGLGGTYTISSNILLEVNGGFLRYRLGATYAPDLDLGDYGVTGLHIPGTNGSSYLEQGTPAFIVTGWNSMGNSDTGNPFQFKDEQYVGNSNLSWIKGHHSLRFGTEYTRNDMNHFQPQGGAFQTARGSFEFRGSVTALSGGATANQANSLAQFLLGVPDEVGRADQVAIPNSIRWRTWSMYARDSWQVTSKLTVNYGLRWEFYPMANSDHGGVKLYNPLTNDVYIGGHGSVPLNDGVSVGHGEFLPRFGLAYRLGSKTVVRAGYGMSADSNNWRFFRNNYPATINSDVPGTTSFYPVASLTGETLTPYPSLTAGIPIVAVPNISSGVVPLPTNVNPGDTVPFNFRRGYIHSYNLTVQREFAGFVAEAAYVGARGIRMLTNENLNAAPIGGGATGEYFYSSTGNSNSMMCLCPDANMYYDGLQTKISRRFGTGSMIGALYTYSKAINSDDDEEVSGIFGGQGGSLFWPYPAYKSRNKALATFDRPHNLGFYGIEQLPFGRTQRWAKAGMANKLAGGWQFNWLLSRMSGYPMTLSYSGGIVNANGNTQTADQIGPLRILGGIGPAPIIGQSVSCAATNMTCHYFDPTSFQTVPGTQARFGTTGRNIIFGPGWFNLDASLFRDFNLTEHVKLQIRAEMFGATNTPHYNNPGTDPTVASTFGVITSTWSTAGRGTGSGGERWTWVAAKLIF
jgi:hypothetical protein